MKTQAEEIENDIAHEDKAIAFAKESVAHYSKMLKKWCDQLAEAERRKATLERQLERELTVMQKVQPVGVKIGAFDV